MNENPYDRWLEPLNDGESQVKSYLRAQGYKVADVSDEPKYWKLDVDILAYKDTIENEVMIEVKNDGVISRSGNFFLELLTDVDKHKVGWFTYTAADYIYYRDKVNEITYILPLPNLKAYVAAHIDEINIRRANDYRRDGTVSKVSEGYTLPIKDFIGEYPQTQIVNI